MHSSRVSFVTREHRTLVLHFLTCLFVCLFVCLFYSYTGLVCSVPCRFTTPVIVFLAVSHILNDCRYRDFITSESLTGNNLEAILFQVSLRKIDTECRFGLLRGRCSFGSTLI